MTDTPKPIACGEPAELISPRIGSWACVLPIGHEGKHQRGGTCFKHGPYVGDKCYKWPNCEMLPPTMPIAAPKPMAEDLQGEYQKWAGSLQYEGAFICRLIRRASLAEAQLYQTQRDKEELLTALEDFVHCRVFPQGLTRLRTLIQKHRSQS